MKNDKELINTTKIYALGNLGVYKKAIPIARINGVKFDESNFKIRFDLKTIPASDGSVLSIGDTCNINNGFYNKLFKTSISQYTVWDPDNHFGKEFVVIAFVEMFSKNHYEIFCALKGVFLPGFENPDGESITKMVDMKNGSLLLFWPESLIKLEKE
jgi:hypothetical protein